MLNTFYYCHRINKVDELKKVSKDMGIELDLRDNITGEIMVVHDPFKEGENFDTYLNHYDKSSIILNVKSERIEYKIIELLKKWKIDNYFFLDCSFPMINELNKIGEKNIAIRYSEYESLESVILVKNMVKWVWVDCFNNFPLTLESYKKIKELGLKICLVSPELQGHNISKIYEFKKFIIDNQMEIDAICTKSYNIRYWKKEI